MICSFACLGGMVSYTIPDSPMPELSDSSYDGARENGMLSGGLGCLIDGEIGADNYRMDTGYGRGNSNAAFYFPHRYLINQLILHHKSLPNAH